MDKDTKDILETVNFIKDHMVTKADFDDAVEKLDSRLTAVESKIGGIHNRIDDEALKRGNLENHVRSVLPNLPPPPERVKSPATTTSSSLPILPVIAPQHPAGRSVHEVHLGAR
jgi:hypothetical protein